MNSEGPGGTGPLSRLLHFRAPGVWKARLPACAHSGEAAVAGLTSDHYDVPQRQFLLELARSTLKRIAANDSPPEPAAAAITAKLAEKRACFVTLTKEGQLRGCMGHLWPQEALYRAVIKNACSAALRDPRFPPVREEEVERVRIEISVLTEPQRLSFTSVEELLQKLQPHRDGVMLQLGYCSATFLPQVWAQFSSKEDFLNRLAEKAGCEPFAWRGAEVLVSTYQAESFEEAADLTCRN